MEESSAPMEQTVGASARRGRGQLVGLFLLLSLSMWAAGYLGTQMVVHWWPGVADQVLSDYVNSDEIASTATFGVVVSPLLETATLLYGLHLAKQVVTGSNVAIVVGTLPVLGLHLLLGWRLSIVAIVPFLLQAYVASRLWRGHSTTAVVLFVAAAHGVVNATTILVTVWVR